MQDAVVNMDPISLIITSLDVKGAFPNTPHRLLRTVWNRMGLPFQGFLQAYLGTRMYAVKIDVGTIPWVGCTSGVPQGGAEGPFVFLLVTLPLAFYIRRTYPDVAPYPLRPTLLAFADDMAVVTATARQPLPTTPDTIRTTKVLHDVTNYLEGNQLLVHSVKSATMVHNPPSPPLRPGEPPMNTVSTATYLGVQQAATTNEVTVPPHLIRQLTRTLVIARIVVLSMEALAYSLQAILNAAIEFQALRLKHPQTNATGGPCYSTASVDSPRPPTHVTTRGGARSVTTVLWGQHRSPRQQRIHGSQRDPRAPSHSQS